MRPKRLNAVLRKVSAPLALVANYEFPYTVGCFRATAAMGPPAG